MTLPTNLARIHYPNTQQQRRQPAQTTTKLLRSPSLLGKPDPRQTATRTLHRYPFRPSSTHFMMQQLPASLVSFTSVPLLRLLHSAQIRLGQERTGQAEGFGSTQENARRKQDNNDGQRALKIFNLNQKMVEFNNKQEPKMVEFNNNQN